MNKAYLLTGGNTGDRLGFLKSAVSELETSCGKILKLSPIFETAAWGKTDQQSFLNQALLLKTDLSATELMTAILKTEKKMGRVREEKYGPRTIDIDILLFNEDLFESAFLRIPHPELANRRFALEPLASIAPRYRHPILKKTIKRLLKECKDSLQVRKVD